MHSLIERKMQHNEERSYILKIVALIRADHPTLSCRFMYYKIKPASMGNDAFEQLCDQYGYKTALKRNRHRTTDSSSVVSFNNLTISLILTSINQIYSSDITCYEINERFYYVTFIMDYFSRYILGHAVSDRLTTEKTTLPA